MEPLTDFSFQNLDLLKYKNNCAMELIQKGWMYRNYFEYSIECFYHDVPLRLLFTTERQKDSVLKLIPKEWMVKDDLGLAINVYFYSPSSFKKYHVNWEEEVTPDCQIYHQGLNEIAVQRDFVGVIDKYGDVGLIVKDLQGDGFFNAFRWFLPRKMFHQENTLLHSSCVIGKDGKAHFFLGHSGAGKSTIASLADQRVVLGDDMNVLQYKNGLFYAKPGVLGGEISHIGNHNEFYPVGSFYWIVKDTRIYKKKMSKSSSFLKFISSCTNLFWKQNSDSNLIGHKIMELASNITSLYEFYQLHFTLSKDFWEYVDGKYKDCKE